jgi:hypothetical protein
VKDITKSDTPLKVLSRGGTTKIDKECTLPGYPSQVWFDTNGVANIIGLRNLIRHYAVTYDSSGDNCFHVWKDDKAVMTFQPWEGGLWYYDKSENRLRSPFSPQWKIIKEIYVKGSLASRGSTTTSGHCKL